MRDDMNSLGILVPTSSNIIACSASKSASSRRRTPPAAGTLKVLTAEIVVPVRPAS